MRTSGERISGWRSPNHVLRLFPLEGGVSGIDRFVSFSPRMDSEVKPKVLVPTTINLVQAESLSPVLTILNCKCRSILILLYDDLILGRGMI